MLSFPILISEKGASRSVERKVAPSIVDDEPAWFDGGWVQNMDFIVKKSKFKLSRDVKGLVASERFDVEES